VHIDGERAGMWSRHLRRFFEGMYSDATVTSRDNLHWRLESESTLKHVIFKHKNGLCIIAGGVKAEKGLCSILEQIKETRDCGASGWCQLFVDMSSAPSCLKIPDYLEDTRIRLTMENRNGAVRSKIVLDYPAPIEVELEKWNIPENLVRDPLVGFTAVRGFRQCLARTDAIRDIGLTNPPSQAFFWSQGVNPFMLSYAFPTEDASGYLSHIAERFRESPTEMMKNLGIGEFDWNPETRVLRWLGLPIIVPRLEVPGDANSKYIGGGLFPPLESTNPAPAELFKQVKGRSDLVYYDWEITQARLPQAHFLNFVYGLLNASRKHTAMQQGSQTMSKNTPENNAPEKRSGSDTKPDKRESVENKSALSTTKEARAASAPTSGPLFQAYSDWLKKTTPLLENTVTEVTIESPCRMELKRKSDIGLTSFELAILGNLLSDRNRNIPGPTAIPQPGIRNEGPGDGE
ncbi:MAG: hypothetical protein K9N48_09240, partial [Verrucomicrobia bacterium]|nr:hypothetical protein [Verrucomicrobiota bacterium]